MLVATANSGGYRYGVADQAFYVPAISLKVSPELFPRDRALLEPQMRLWVGDEILGGLVRLTGVGIPGLFAGLYVLTLLLLACGGAALARALSCRGPTLVLFLALLTLHHQILGTGASSLEGYFHPRMLAFGCGLFALAAVARARGSAAVAWLALAAMVHTTTAIWFGVVVAASLLWPWRRSPRLWLALGGAVIVAVGALAVLSPDRLSVMDPAWAGVIQEKTYLFSAEWKIHEWLANLGYMVLIAAIYHQRVRRGEAVKGEAPLVAGLAILVVGFLVSVPLAQARWALAVQMQVNRIFWVLDPVALLYLAWWLTHGTPRLSRERTRRLFAATGIALAVARGAFVLALETGRPLATLDLPAGGWTDAMRWLATQPVDWHVLADPDHAWKYGSSVRVAARRDTLIELEKDTAMAMYDRRAAAGVRERRAATAGFASFDEDDIRALDERFSLDVLVDSVGRDLDLPVLYRNESFLVYDLR